MKKLLVPVLLMLSIANPALAQRGKKKKFEPQPYIRVGVGYGLSNAAATQSPIAFYNYRQSLPQNGSSIVNITSSQFSETFDLKRSSYSEGLHATLARGIMLSDHIGVELGATVGLITKKITTDYVENDPNTKVSLNVAQKVKLPVMITPAIVLQTGGKINLYARGGIVLPVLSRINVEGNYNEQRLNAATGSFIQYRSILWTEEFKMRLSPGFSGAVGIKHSVSKGFSVWGEVGILSMSLYYKTSEIMDFNLVDINGTTTIGNLSPAQRSSNYEFQGTATANSNTYPTGQVSFSNVNLMMGISLDL